MISLLCLALAAEVPAPEPEEHDSVWIQASEVLEVSDREATAAALISAATQRGGYFSALTDTSVTLRVPVTMVPEMVAEASKLGTVRDRGYQSQDLSEELRTLRVRLSSRQASLDRYLKVLGEAGADALVAVGRQVDASITDIEQIQGRIRLLEHQADFARIDFSFQFRDRSAPVATGTSSFHWINQLNLADILAAFQRGNGGGYSPGATMPAPEGFAPYSRPARFAAVSPDDVKLRLRIFRNKPKADLEFWKEAVRIRFAQAGYRVVGVEDLVATGGPLALIALAAPSGAHDYSYHVAIAVDGNRIIVVEMVGEAARFEAHQAAMRTALAGLDF